MVQEVKAKFEDSTKLLNLTASCYLGNKDFKKAETTLKRLYEFFGNNEEQANPHEYDQCLRNLVVVSTCLGRGQDVISGYLTELSERTDGNDPLIDKAGSFVE